MIVRQAFWLVGVGVYRACGAYRSYRTYGSYRSYRAYGLVLIRFITLMGALISLAARPAL